MTLKTAHVSDILILDQVPKKAAAALSLYAPICFSEGVNEYGGDMKNKFQFGKFMVMGHRGSGMNILHSSDSRMKSIKQNSILSFNAANQFPIDFIEFDVQVTKDECPIIFHDNSIFTEEKGSVVDKRVTDITLHEFLSYGPQKEFGKVGRPLSRKSKADGKFVEWKVEIDAPLCTLQEAFQNVEKSVGFNIELKFDDEVVYTEEKLVQVLQAIQQVVNDYAKDRPIMFSSFQPDAALLMRTLQDKHPVFFLTNGGSQIYKDIRKNSLDKAIKVCMSGGLHGIVSEVRAILRNPGTVSRIKESKIAIITYGQLNNVSEVVYMQHLMGVEGVIVDLVPEITEAVAHYNISPTKENEGKNILFKVEEAKKSQLSQHEVLSFLLKLIPDLVKN